MDSTHAGWELGGSAFSLARLWTLNHLFQSGVCNIQAEFCWASSRVPFRTSHQEPGKIIFPEPKVAQLWSYHCCRDVLSGDFESVSFKMLKVTGLFSVSWGPLLSQFESITTTWNTQLIKLTTPSREPSMLHPNHVISTYLCVPVLSAFERPEFLCARVC